MQQHLVHCKFSAPARPECDRQGRIPAELEPASEKPDYKQGGTLSGLSWQVTDPSMRDWPDLRGT